MANFRSPLPYCYSEPLPLSGGLFRPPQFGCVTVPIWNWPAGALTVPGVGAKTGAKLRWLSTNGLWFIYKHEAAPNVSNHLHWPQGASGVTLGPGYDMKERSAASIVADMKAIGLTDAAAQVVSQAAGLTGDKAKNFAHGHKKDVDLTDAQQVSLLKHVVKHYERMVRKAMTIPVSQSEFDALVSFAYNPAGRWHSVTHFLNKGSVTAAMKKIRQGNTSKGKVLPGLTRRRDDEVKLYLDGKYAMNGHAIPSH
ncbi:MAG: glycoside hydrolase family protein [Rhodanobacter sp.]